MIPCNVYPVGTVIPIHFSTYDADNASVTFSGLAVTDVEIYKGIGVVQRSNDAGVGLIDTDGIDIDGMTGAGGVYVDTSNDTDAGFYAAGSIYHVWISAITIDGQTVRFIAEKFMLSAAVTTSGVPKVDTSSVAGTVLQGDGTVGDPWRPA